MPGPNTFSDQSRHAIVRAVVDDGRKIPHVLKDAKAGQLDGYDHAGAAPSATTVRDWVALERRLRRRQRINDPNEAVTDLVEKALRETLDACYADLDALNKAKAGDRDHSAVVRTLRTIRDIAREIERDTPSDKTEEDKLPKVPQSGVLEAVAKVQEASRANTPQDMTGTTETGNAEAQASHDTQHTEQEQAEQDGRGHLLNRAEERARERMAAVAGKNGGSSG